MSTIDQFNHLTPAEELLARQLVRPQAVVFGATIVLTALGAMLLAYAIAQNSTEPLLVAIGKMICGPGKFTTELGTSLLFSFAVWSAMTIVMMLPGAAPMLLTYAEIADTAAEKNIPAVSPLALVAGYLIVWLGFSLAIAVVETALLWNFDLAGTAVGAYLTSASLLLAGLYQFSNMKHACLSRCRRPFAFFFAHWTDRSVGVFQLGLRQGLLCLGCCWALMLTMLAVGSMNLIWMVALAIFMAIEKMTTSAMLPRVAGAALLFAGTVVFLTNVTSWSLL